MAKTVYVGMSGGVDSSLTAALLLEQGYKVVGVFMKNWTADVAGFTCPWRADFTDAQSVAAKLGIPLEVYDFQTEYKQKVVDYMIEQYQVGYTPNPDIMCNQEIKFRLFLDTAISEGADLIATGHYARIKNRQLLMGKDKSKDQSYFLYRVTRQALAKSLMPLGEMTKPEVRKQATAMGLPNADKPDSQGICFIGEVLIRDFLAEYIKPKPGPIKTADGKEIGQHDGAAFYTIGQRHGLGVGGGRPYYVMGKDIKTNTVFVTDNPAADTLHRAEFLIDSPHWIDQKPKPKKTYQLRMRYRGNLIDGQLIAIGLYPIAKYRVELSEPERAVTPGQSAVVYEGEQVLGGGVISLV